MDTKIVKTLEGLKTFHYPRYSELPEGLVFLNDIVRQVNNSHVPIPFEMRNNKKLFTVSMATNYIKQGLTPPPIGKKYNRDHICFIYFAAIMKLVFDSDNVLALSKKLFTQDNMEAVNDALAETFEQSLACYVEYGLLAADASAKNLTFDPEREIREHSPATQRREAGGNKRANAWEGISPDVHMLVNFVSDTFASKAVAVAMLGGSPVDE